VQEARFVLFTPEMHDTFARALESLG